MPIPKRFFRRAPLRPLIQSLVVATTLGLVLTAPPSAAQVNLPSLGDSVSQDLDVVSERKFGDEIMAEVWADPAYVDDPLLQEYVEGIFRRLVASSRKLGNITDETVDHFAWQPFLVLDKSINAFALPGGFVGVHLGLIAMTGADDELASVMGHELSHVTQRHIARRIVGDSRNGLLATAGLIAAVLAAARGSPDAAQAAIMTSQAAAQAASLAFSRDMEREADRVGFQVMVGAGYSPSGMSSMFERMEQAFNLSDSGDYPYLRTHPLTSERIADARARIGAAPYVRPTGTPEHAMLAARARVLMDPRAVPWRALQDLDRGTRDQAGDAPLLDQLAARYASALASIKLRDFDRSARAIDAAQTLLAQLPDSADRGGRGARDLVFLRAELAEARGDAAAGFAALQTLGADKSRPLLLERAALALVDRDPAPARAVAEDLQTFVALHDKDILAWAELARLWTRLGHTLRSVRAQAESSLAAGDLNGAIDRMRSALRMSSARDADQYEAAIIDARLRTLTYERRRLLKERYPNGVPGGGEPQ